jgi:hypothetical protein
LHGSLTAKHQSPSGSPSNIALHHCYLPVPDYNITTFKGQDLSHCACCTPPQSVSMAFMPVTRRRDASCQLVGPSSLCMQHSLPAALLHCCPASPLRSTPAPPPGGSLRWCSAGKAACPTAVRGTQAATCSLGPPCVVRVCACGSVVLTVLVQGRTHNGFVQAIYGVLTHPTSAKPHSTAQRTSPTHRSDAAQHSTATQHSSTANSNIAHAHSTAHASQPAT